MKKSKSSKINEEYLFFLNIFQLFSNSVFTSCSYFVSYIFSTNFYSVILTYPSVLTFLKLYCLLISNFHLLIFCFPSINSLILFINFLFVAKVDALLSNKKRKYDIRFIVLDFTLVLAIDSSAADTMGKIIIIINIDDDYSNNNNECWSWVTLW